jgi:hypothetical protein
MDPRTSNGSSNKQVENSSSVNVFDDLQSGRDESGVNSGELIRNIEKTRNQKDFVKSIT